MSEEKAKMKKGSSKKRSGKRTDGRLEKKVTTGYNPITGKPIRKSIYGNTKSKLDDKLIEFKYMLKTGQYIEPKKEAEMKLLESGFCNSSVSIKNQRSELKPIPIILTFQKSI